MGQTRHGAYTPLNKEKYIGQQLPTYRSSWELRAFISLDKNPNVLKWGSENVVIPYVDRTRGGEIHRYYMDLYFETATEKWLIEIKPDNQASYDKVKKPKKMTQKSYDAMQNQTMTIARNQCKWQAAMQFCKDRGWHFGVYTESGIKKIC